MIGIEAEVGVIPSEWSRPVFDVWNLAYRAHLIFQFQRTDDEKLIPFAFSRRRRHVGRVERRPDTRRDQQGHRRRALRRHRREVPRRQRLRSARRRSHPVPAELARARRPTDDYEVLLSIYREFGRKKKPAKAARRPKDSDGDGIPDDNDKCPNEPEDKDGFQDEDGCPDPDNDGDGIPDASDKCPNEPEDKDGFQDADGCPDPDNDGDGIPDARTSARTSPRTRTASRTLTAARIPTTTATASPMRRTSARTSRRPRTASGRRRLPDEMPEKLKKFTGVIQGINFQVGSDEILPSSNGVLDKAIKVLKEFKDIKVEIQGHTDDQPLPRAQVRTTTTSCRRHVPSP